MTEERQLSEKDQRAADCMAEIRDVLKKHNCVILPLTIEGPDDKGNMVKRYDCMCVALSNIVEGTQAP